MKNERPKAPVMLVLFGAGGDLTWRLIGPALFNLHLDGRLPERFVLQGVDRKDYDDQALRVRLRDGA